MVCDKKIKPHHERYRGYRVHKPCGPKQRKLEYAMKKLSRKQKDKFLKAKAKGGKDFVDLRKLVNKGASSKVLQLRMSSIVDELVKSDTLMKRQADVMVTLREFKYETKKRFGWSSSHAEEEFVKIKNDSKISNGKCKMTGQVTVPLAQGDMRARDKAVTKLSKIGGKPGKVFTQENMQTLADHDQSSVGSNCLSLCAPTKAKRGRADSSSGEADEDDEDEESEETAGHGDASGDGDPDDDSDGEGSSARSPAPTPRGKRLGSAKDATPSNRGEKHRQDSKSRGHNTCKGTIQSPKYFLISIIYIQHNIP